MRKAFEDPTSATTGIFDTADAETITVRATTSFAVLWLTPRLVGFRHRHPGIDIHLIMSIRTEGLPPDQGSCDSGVQQGDLRNPCSLHRARRPAAQGLAL
ncbi:MAG: hypothetical protein GDA49_02760 [Rhodospirillales bacterium]|nr:hypothetical protein [Rhodospirillales bacterium]